MDQIIQEIREMRSVSPRTKERDVWAAWTATGDPPHTREELREAWLEMVRQDASREQKKMADAAEVSEKTE